MRVAFAADHAGAALKSDLLRRLAASDLGHDVQDLGGDGSDPNDDYPDFAERLGHAVRDGEVERGVLICGSGVGASVAVNKIRGIRSAVCHDTYSAHQGVEHDDMNILTLGSRVIGPEPAWECVVAFLGASFSGESSNILEDGGSYVEVVPGEGGAFSTQFQFETNSLLDLSITDFGDYVYSDYLYGPGTVTMIVEWEDENGSHQGTYSGELLSLSISLCEGHVARPHGRRLLRDGWLGYLFLRREHAARRCRAVGGRAQGRPAGRLGDDGLSPACSAGPDRVGPRRAALRHAARHGRRPPVHRRPRFVANRRR
jgi:ribose 5-phosphate isomerase B